MNRDTIYILYHAPVFFFNKYPQLALRSSHSSKCSQVCRSMSCSKASCMVFSPENSRTTADPQPTFTEVKKKFDRAMQLGSNEERIIHEFCDQMQIPFDKIASEDFSAFMRILSLSKLLKNPNNMRGKARPQAYHGTKKKKRK